MIVHPGEEEDFYDAVKRVGYVKDDFEISEKEDPFPTQGVGAITGEVTVRNKRTGAARTYRGGHGTHWVYEFEKDLKAGAFAA